MLKTLIDQLFHSPKITLGLLLLGTLSSTSAFAKEPLFEQVIYPNNQRQNYPIILLDLALRETGKTYVITPSPTSYEQKRALIDLASGNGLDVSWSMTTADRESMLEAIRIPIFKGLIGWRIPLVHSQARDLLANTGNLKDLQQYKAGQMHDWPDTPILEWNGITVFRSSTYEGLFKMLAMRRIDIFPRSVIEIWRELDTNANMQIAVDENTLIHYPTAFYYFVSKKNKVLAKDIRTGLETLIANGTFDALFLTYHQDYLDKAKVGQRKIIKLKNPLLPPQTPVDRKDLWFDPDSMAQQSLKPKNSVIKTPELAQSQSSLHEPALSEKFTPPVKPTL